jgi:hypothetical protein
MKGIMIAAENEQTGLGVEKCPEKGTQGRRRQAERNAKYGCN